MDAPSPARLYASAVGAGLVALGIVGFFYSASFGSPGDVEQALGVFAVNGWSNVLHILTGVLGLYLATYASRAYSLGMGAAYVGLALWGFALGGDGAILDCIPVGAGIDLLHLVLGALGVVAALATPRQSRKGAAATA